MIGSTRAPRSRYLQLWWILGACLLSCDAQLPGKGPRASNPLKNPYDDIIQAPPAPFEVNRKIVLSPGEGRVVILNAAELARYNVTLSVTTLYNAPSKGGSSVMDTWPRQDTCNGSNAGLMAVAYREDELPDGIFPPLAFSMHYGAPDAYQRLDIALLDTDCSAEALNNVIRQQSDNNALDMNSPNVTFRTYQNSTWASYWVSSQQIGLLANISNGSQPCSSSRCPERDRVVYWPNQAGFDFAAASSPDVHRNDSIYSQIEGPFRKHWNSLSPEQQKAENWDNITQTYVRQFFCSINHAELNSPLANITVSKRERNECAVGGAKIYVFVHNCLASSSADNTNISWDPSLLVSVRLDFVREGKHNASCYSPADHSLKLLNVVTLCLVASVTFVGFTATLLTFFWSKVCPACCDGKGQCTADRCCTGCTGCIGVRALWATLAKAIESVHNPSGYSRFYTVAVTTSAALLVAAIVWQPTVSASAQHDHAWLDNPSSPVKDASNVPQAAQTVVYYLKVMGISALIGYTVKLALLANLGVPEPRSEQASDRSISIDSGVWRAQVAISTIGMVLLTLIVVSNVGYMLRQFGVWTLKAPYLYLMIILILHQVTAMVCFIWIFYINPPPLKATDRQPLELPRTHPAGTVTPNLRLDDDTAATTDQNVGKADNRTKDTDGSGRPHPTNASPAPATPSSQGTFIDPVKRWIKEAFLEDEDFRYSAWILSPVWLSLCLMIFWYLMGITRSDVIMQCIKSPQDCVAGHLHTFFGVAESLFDGPTVQYVMQLLQEIKLLMDTEYKVIGVEIGAANLLRQTDSAPDMFLDTFVRVLHTYADTFQWFSDMTQDIYKGWDVWWPRMQTWEAQAESAYRAGRWVGFTLATVCAFASLLVILRTFKRVLVHQAKQASLRRLYSSESGSRRAMATYVSGLYPCNSIPKTHSTTIHPNGAEAAAATAEATDSGKSVCAKLEELWDNRRRSARQYNSKRASTEIMYTIQTLEADMSNFGIGSSVALFGVLVSTMWIQIRLFGSILMILFTVLFYPEFQTQVLHRSWVTILSLILLVLFNMLVVKNLVGSSLLSNGTTIKYKSAFMTFFLVCQFAFLVIGVLYASWRVVLAIIFMLLYGVATLDRSILFIFKFLDGSYIAFVTSIKLEAAWRDFSQPSQALAKDPEQFQDCLDPVTEGSEGHE